MYNHILVPSDGSELSNNGVQHGLQLAKALNCKVTAFTVSEPFILYTGARGAGWVANEHDLKHYTAMQDEYTENVLKQISEEAAKLGLSISTRRVEYQFPADAIIEEATKLGCDLIVMASHGRRGLSRLLLGSQTSEVVTRSTIPVLVVR